MAACFYFSSLLINDTLKTYLELKEANAIIPGRISVKIGSDSLTSTTRTPYLESNPLEKVFIVNAIPILI